MAFNPNPFGAPQNNNKRPSQASSSNLFSPAASTNSIFSSSTASTNPFESPVNPGRSAFAGHTPAKTSSGRSLFGVNGQPSVQFGHNTAAGSGLFGAKPRSRRGSRGSQEDIQIHEDDSEMQQEEEEVPTDVDEDYSFDGNQEDDDTGMYGDEEDYDDTMDNGDNDLTPTKPGRDGEEFQEEEEDSELPEPATEPGQLIMRTERLMHELAEQLAGPQGSDGESEYQSDMEMDGMDPVERHEVLMKYAKQFTTVLHQETMKSRDRNGGPLLDGMKISSLMLSLRHSPASVAEAIRKWMHFNQAEPSPAEMKTFKTFHPNPACFPDFWPLIHRLAIRGEIHEIIDVIQHSDWSTLSSGESGGAKNQMLFQSNNAKRYSKDEASAIAALMKDCLAVLKKIPGKGRNSYNPPLQFFPAPSTIVDSPGTPAEWRIHRGNVEAAAHKLREAIADKPDTDSSYDDEDSYFAPAQTNTYGFGLAPNRAPRVKPPTEFTGGLRELYEILKGQRSTIIAAADNFMEAVHGIVYYCREVDDLDDEAEWIETEIWNPDTELNPYDLLKMRQEQRERDLLRMSKATDEVLEAMVGGETIHQLDRSNEFELTIAAVFADDPKVVAEVPDFSPLCAATLVEIGGHAGWCVRGSEKTKEDRESGMMGAFDEDDLAVLGFGRDGEKTEEEEEAEINDDIVKGYAATLMATEWLDKDSGVEGWEIAVGVLSRVAGGMDVAKQLLPKIPNTTPERTTKLLTHCLSTPSLAATASYIAYSYSLSLPGTPSTLGLRLQNLALAAPHLPQAYTGIHTLIQSLIRRSLTLHAAFPPAEELDETLASLLASPKNIDSETLRSEIGGYATLRRWYETRDPAALVAVVRAAGEQIDEMAWDREWRCGVEPRWVPTLVGVEVAGLLAEKEGARKLGEEGVMTVVRVLGDWEAVGGEVVKAIGEEEKGDEEEVVGMCEVQEGWEGRVRLRCAKALAGIWVAK